MALPRCSTTLLPAFLLLCYVNIGSVTSFVSFLPTSSDDVTSDNFENFDQQSLQNAAASDDKLLYRLLYNVILDKLHTLDQAENTDFISRPDTGAYKKRGFPGLERMSKRKVFWQPIGLLPGKVSQSGGNGRQGQAASHNQAGQPFRYG